MSNMKDWLLENLKVIGAIKDIIAIVAAPLALVTFGFAVLQYQTSVNTERAKTLLELRKQYAELVQMIGAANPPTDKEWLFVFQHMETIWFLRRFGKLDDEFWKTFDAQICPAFKLGPVPYWTAHQNEFSPGFRVYVNDSRRTC